MTTYETLLRLAFRAPADQAHYLSPATLGAYGGFAQATPATSRFASSSGAWAWP